MHRPFPALLNLLIPLLACCGSATSRHPTQKPTASTHETSPVLGSPTSASQTSASQTSASPAEASAVLGSADLGYEKVMTAMQIDGTQVERQARPTVIVFFASWCGPCRRELADLGEIHTRYPDLRVIGLSSYEDFRDYSDQHKLQAFLSEHAPWMVEVVRADAQLLADFGMVPRIPTLLIYDAQGRIRTEFRRDQRHPPSRDELEAAIIAASQAT